MDLEELFVRGVEIKLKMDEIQRLEAAASQSQGAMQLFLQAQADNVKQTVEVIKLTRIMTILTIGLFFIGILQLCLAYLILAKP